MDRTLQLASQFTEDVLATQDSLCERSSCRAIIKTGQQRHYIANQIAGHSGKYVCANCYQHYRNNPSTTISMSIYLSQSLLSNLVPSNKESIQRPSTLPLNAQAPLPFDRSQFVDAARIREGVNTSQRGLGTSYVYSLTL